MIFYLRSSAVLKYLSTFSIKTNSLNPKLYLLQVKIIYFEISRFQRITLNLYSFAYQKFCNRVRAVFK
ncbi:hypothetical protein LCDVSa088L [Lymphocystis disease virus 3]|uniref:Uncharacterized protein n=1 Tax=Lymphocystis disease virus 3 TaxID=2560566 RepID=A0A1B2RVZ2_9VIRU|nr:hypothetical protein BZK12_gp088 [Lymphocystis disease virus Sa]AOC55172.1 hypothetical protein LCDVSa088L [Lymphocystis disease virus 3]